MPRAATVTIELTGESARLVSELLKAEKANKKSMRKMAREQKRASVAGKQAFGAIKVSIAGLIGALGTREIIRYADTWVNVGNRLRLVSKDAKDLIAIQRRVLNLAQETRSDLVTTAELYTRLSIATKDLNATQDENFQVTRAVSQAAQLSGATTAQANAAVIQFTQGLAGGIFRAEEFNSVLENTPRLAQAIAAGLGRTIGELRGLVIAGELTADQVLAAISNQADRLDNEFKTIVPTFQQSTTNLGNAVIALIGELDKIAGAASGGASGISNLADTITDDLIPSLSTIGEASAAVSGFFQLLAVIATGKIPKLAEEWSLVNIEIKETEAALVAAQEKLQGILDQPALGGRQRTENDFGVARLLTQIDQLGRKLQELRAPEILKASEGEDVGDTTPIPVKGKDDGKGRLLSTETNLALEIEAIERANQRKLEQERLLRQSIFAEREAAIQTFAALAAQQAEAEFLAALEAERAAKESAGIPFTAEDVLKLRQEQNSLALQIVKQFEADRTNLELEGAKKRKKIAEQEAAAKAKIKQMEADAATKILWGLAHQSELAGRALFLFEKYKAAKDIWIHTQVAAAKALSVLGPIAGPPVAAAITAAGVASAAAVIASGIQGPGATGGGGGGIGVIGSGTVETTTTTSEGTETSRKEIQIIFQGNVYGWDDYVREQVINGIREAVDDSDVILIGGESRQGQVIREQE